MPTPIHRYPSVLIGLHWLTLALLVVVYALIELHGVLPKGSAERALAKSGHFMAGLSVFALVLVRLPLRLALHAPPITPAPPTWQVRLARAMHLLLYALLLALPLLGWCTLSAKGQTIPFFGLQLPPLLAVDKALGRTLQQVHETLGNLGYALIGLHAAAALAHHYLQRDDTLVRMLPRRCGMNRR